MSKSSIQRLYNQNQGRWITLVVVVAVALLGVSVWSWWHFVRSNPQRTFYAAINNNLRTTSVTRSVTQASGAQKLDQRVHLGAGAHNAAHGLTTISQKGPVNATIKTETISTPKEDYVRYTQIDTDQKNSKGKVIDFSKLLNIWGKTTATDLGQQVGQLFNESTMGVVPAGNLTAADRTAIMEYVRSKEVYKFDQNKVGRKLENGRPVYVYEVSVTPEQYVTMLKRFAQAMGMTQFDSVDPAQYKNAEPMKFTLKVDVWGQHLTGISYPGTDRSEKYGSHGVLRNVEIPTNAIPTAELQQKLKAVQ